MTSGITFHGGASDLIEDLFPHAPKPWVDLSTGINPHPYPFSHPEQSSAWHLPTRLQMDECRLAMANAINSSEESMLLAPGSELLIRLMPTVLKARHVAVVKDSYADHHRVWSRSGAQVVAVPDPVELASECDVVVVCNPNNPDGRIWNRNTLRAAYQTLASRGGCLIIDEAYADLDLSLSLAEDAGTEGLVILRSLGKFYGLAGIRLGALLGPPEIRAAMEERLGVWPVPGPTLQIAVQAYRDTGWQADTRRILSSKRATLDAQLDDTELTVLGGTDLFRFVHTPNASRVWESLAQQGIYTRMFDWSETCLRIGLPAGAEQSRRLTHSLGQLAL